jgi:hypothetical protein
MLALRIVLTSLVTVGLCQYSNGRLLHYISFFTFFLVFSLLQLQSKHKGKVFKSHS